MAKDRKTVAGLVPQLETVEFCQMHGGIRGMRGVIYYKDERYLFCADSKHGLLGGLQIQVPYDGPGTLWMFENIPEMDIPPAPAVVKRAAKKFVRDSLNKEAA